LLRKQNKRKRLLWARKHQHWTIQQWKKVLWTDESKFEIFGSKTRTYVRRCAGERVLEACTKASVKHGGGSVMVWGCFGNNQVGDLVKIEGILLKEGYKSNLEQHVLPNGRRLIGRGFIFQEDNDPKHSSKLCRNFMADKEKHRYLYVMEWPAQSPDLNPIELLWDEIDRTIRKKSPTSKSHLWQILQQSWSEINNVTLEKLVKRMPRLCKAVIKNNGGHIDEANI
jgi:transposase